jgi:hypothetical protein
MVLCDYFNAKYNVNGSSGKLKDKMSWKGYHLGHMALENKILKPLIKILEIL